MSDDIEKTHLTPGRIRFCPLCGHGLERRAVPPDGRPEMVCTGCDFIYYLSPKVVAGTVPIGGPNDVFDLVPAERLEYRLKDPQSLLSHQIEA